MTTGEGRSTSSRSQVHVAVDVVEPQLDQLGPLLNQVPVLGDHVPVPAAGNADANHGNRRCWNASRDKTRSSRRARPPMLVDYNRLQAAG